MSDSVLVALLSLCGTLAGAFGGIMVANRLANYRIGQLENRMDKHNALFDRMFCTEKQLDVLGEQVKGTERRLQTLEQSQCWEEV